MKKKDKQETKEAIITVITVGVAILIVWLFFHFAVVSPHILTEDEFKQQQQECWDKGFSAWRSSQYIDGIYEPVRIRCQREY